MGLGLFRGNKLGYGLSCTDHLAFHGEKTGNNQIDGCILMYILTYQVCVAVR